MKKTSASIILLLSVTLFFPGMARATTYWWKVAPSACAVDIENHNWGINDYTYGDIGLTDPGSGSRSVNFYCPVFLPHGAVANLLRIRTFQSGGLPDDTTVDVYIKRKTWNGTNVDIATAQMVEDQSSDDSADFSETINNESYHYVILVTLSTTSYYSYGTPPKLGMIEIRYTN